MRTRSPLRSKQRKGEEFALERAHELPLLILRPCAVYGPRDRDVYPFYFKIPFSQQDQSHLLPFREQHISLCYVEDNYPGHPSWPRNSKNRMGDIFPSERPRDYRMDEIGDLSQGQGRFIPFGFAVQDGSFSESLVSRTFLEIIWQASLMNRGKVEEDGSEELAL